MWLVEEKSKLRILLKTDQAMTQKPLKIPKFKLFLSQMTSEMEIKNPKWIQCDVPDHT